MITMTPKALEKVKEIVLADESLRGQGLRLRVVGGGCSGFTYDLFFDAGPNEFDEVFNEHEVPLFVDPMSFQYLDGTDIDYVESLQGAGFKFENPNVTGKCGCGSSFSA
jgi:iron-sulfur cluster insertion protein